MTTRFLTSAASAALASTLILLGGCTTTFDGNKVDYKSQGKQGPGLEVPPDLSQVNKDTRAAVPRGGAINASTLQGGSNQQQTAITSGVAANSLGDVRVIREGTQRWLLVQRAPDSLWNDVKTFWADNGFTLVVDQPNLGIMETEWNENRAKLPQDGVRKLLGKVLDSLYSTNERDKFRTRLERTATGGTEIYISHRGMTEDFTTSAREQLKWKARPVDPELEVEFLKRLMVKLGGDAGVAQAALDAANPATKGTAVAQAAAPVPRAQVVQAAGQSSLQLTDALEQAWRRVGLSLDRTSFTVEDRDRSKGIYFVRYVEPEADKNAPGFFARMFGAKTKDSLQKYQILVTGVGDQTKVQVANAQGQVIQTPDALRILKVLADDLK
jgi:outer membrane protein assembly factor BamC